jgi:hypothetical protein
LLSESWLIEVQRVQSGAYQAARPSVLCKISRAVRCCGAASS